MKEESLCFLAPWSTSKPRFARDSMAQLWSGCSEQFKVEFYVVW